MKKNKRIWSYALACALAMSNLSAVAMPFTGIVAQAAITPDSVSIANVATANTIYTIAGEDAIVLAAGAEAGDYNRFGYVAKNGGVANITELVSLPTALSSNGNVQATFTKEQQAGLKGDYDIYSLPKATGTDGATKSLATLHFYESLNDAVTNGVTDLALEDTSNQELATTSLSSLSTDQELDIVFAENSNVTGVYGGVTLKSQRKGSTNVNLFTLKNKGDNANEKPGESGKNVTDSKKTGTLVIPKNIENGEYTLTFGVAGTEKTAELKVTITDGIAADSTHLASGKEFTGTLANAEDSVQVGSVWKRYGFGTISLSTVGLKGGSGETLTIKRGTQVVKTGGSGEEITAFTYTIPNESATITLDVYKTGVTEPVATLSFEAVKRTELTASSLANKITLSGKTSIGINEANTIAAEYDEWKAGEYVDGLAGSTFYLDVDSKNNTATTTRGGGTAGSNVRYGDVTNGVFTATKPGKYTVNLIMDTDNDVQTTTDQTVIKSFEVTVDAPTITMDLKEKDSTEIISNDANKNHDIELSIIATADKNEVIPGSTNVSAVQWDVYKASDSKKESVKGSGTSKFTLTAPGAVVIGKEARETVTIAAGTAVPEGDYVAVAYVVNGTAGASYAADEDNTLAIAEYPFTVVDTPVIDGTDANGAVRVKDGGLAPSYFVGSKDTVRLILKGSPKSAKFKLNKSSDSEYVNLNEDTGEFEILKAKDATYKVKIDLDEYSPDSKGVIKYSAADFGANGSIEIAIEPDSLVPAAEKATATVGEKVALTAKYGTKDVSDEITWKSSNTKFVTITSDNEAEILEGGKTVTLTASYKPEGATASITKTITINTAATSYTITTEKGVNTNAARPGNEYNVELVASNELPITSDIVWTSSNEKVAVVEGTGSNVVVKVLSDATVGGTTTIDAKVGNVLATSLKVTVIKAYYKATDDAGKLKNENTSGTPTYYTATLYDTESMTLSATFDGEPVEGTWKEKSAADTLVISGATITATSSDAGTGVYEFYPTDAKNPVISVTVNTEADGWTLLSNDEQKDNVTSTATAMGDTVTKLEVGESVSYTVKLGTKDITNEVEWKSNNKDVLSVSGGVITAIGEGTIPSTVTGTYKTMTITVTVNQVIESTGTNEAADEALEAATAANTAAEAATAAAEAAKNEPTGENIEAANAAVAAAQEAADKATEAAAKATEAAKNPKASKTAAEAAKAAAEAAKNAAAKAQKAIDDAAPVIAEAEAAKAEADKKAEDKANAIAAAKTAAAKATEDHSAANIEAAKKAIEDAKAAGASDEELAEATANVTKAEADKKAEDDQKTEEEKKADAIAAANDAAAKAAAEPTAENIAAAKKAIEDAKTAGASDEQLSGATANETKAEADKKAADDKKTEEQKKAEEEAAAKATAKTNAIAAANTAADAAVANPTAENIKAAQDAVAAAKAAGATDDELKAITDKVTSAETAKANADKKAADQAKGATGKDTKAQANYKVTKNTEKSKTVAYTGTTKKSKKSLTVPKTVTIDGDKFKVTSIASKAFKDSKATKVTINNNITSINKNAFVDSKIKTVYVKGVKLTKSSVKAFNKLPKGAKIKVSGKNKKANIKLLKTLKNVKNGNITVN